MEISRGICTVSLRRCQHFPARENKCEEVAAKAADALVRRKSTVFGRDVQEELDMLRLNESIPYVSIDDLEKAIKAEVCRLGLC